MAKFHRKKIVHTKKKVVPFRKGVLPILISISLILMSISAIFLSSRVVVELTADKGVYNSIDDAEFSVVVIAPTMMRDVFVRVHGIENVNGQEFLYKQQVVDLMPGENIVQFSYIIPYIAPCIGFSPGSYNVNAEVLINNDVIASDRESVEIM